MDTIYEAEGDNLNIIKRQEEVIRRTLPQLRAQLENDLAAVNATQALIDKATELEVQEPEVEESEEQVTE